MKLRNTPLPRRLGAILMLASVLWPSTLNAQDAKAPVKKDLAAPVRVPFDLLKTQHIIVKIKVNDKGPFIVIFDTGAPMNLLSSKLAKDAGMDFKKPFFALLGGGQVKTKSIEIGGARVEGTAAMIMDHPVVALLAQIEKVPIEGLVGLPFFGRYKMTIDYQAKELTFVPNGFDPPDMIDKLTKMMATAGAEPKRKVLAPGALVGVKVAKDASDQDAGVNVKEVFPGSPADSAGLKAGDRLLVLDGRWTDTVLDTYDAATSLRPGTEVRVVIRRDGKEVTKTLKVQSGL